MSAPECDAARDSLHGEETNQFFVNLCVAFEKEVAFQCFERPIQATAARLNISCECCNAQPSNLAISNTCDGICQLPLMSEQPLVGVSNNESDCHIFLMF